MTSAEMSSKTINVQGPAIAQKVSFITGTAAHDTDFFTVTGITTIKGCYMVATDGTVGQCTFTTNVITMINGGTLVWNGFVWGI